MFNALTRIFQTGSASDSSRLSDKGKQRAILPVSQNDGETRPSLDHKASSIMLSRSRSNGPPQINWISPTGSNLSGSFTPTKSGEVLNSSPSAQSVLEPPPSRAGLFGSRKPSIKRISADESLHLQSVYLSEASDSSSVASSKSNVNKPLPLSPINEQEIHAPIRRPSVDSVPTTPDSARTFAQRAFLTRTLNRSVSQASTSTLRSTASQAPSIPPLDLRPPFSPGAVNIPPRKTTRAQPSLPTVIASPRPHVSVIYEDSARGSAGSFRTAASAAATSEGSSVELVEEQDIVRESLGYPEEYFGSERTSRASGHGEGDGYGEGYGGHSVAEASRSRLGLGLNVPEGNYDEVDLTSPLVANPFNDHMNNTTTYSLPLSHHPSHMRLAEAAQSQYPGSSTLHQTETRSEGHQSTSASTVATVETAIQKRWLKGLSFSSTAENFISIGPKKNNNINSACILFWVGFIAPWCWLIGGWYLSTSGEMKPSGQFLDSVRLRWPRDKKHGSLSTTNPYLSTTRTIGRDRTTAMGRVKAQWSKVWDPLFANSKETLPLSQSTSLAFGERRLDPWVARCRVAAIYIGELSLYFVRGK
ncbi:hypothetical protein ABKN59_006577 [Abortiporus biennis]